MKLGLSEVSYKDKLLGEQVAYVLDDMLTAVENGKSTIQSNTSINFRGKDHKLSHKKEEINARIRWKNGKAEREKQEEQKARTRKDEAIADLKERKTKRRHQIGTVEKETEEVIKREEEKGRRGEVQSRTTEKANIEKKERWWRKEKGTRTEEEEKIRRKESKRKV